MQREVQVLIQPLRDQVVDVARVQVTPRGLQVGQFAARKELTSGLTLAAKDPPRRGPNTRDAVPVVEHRRASKTSARAGPEPLCQCGISAQLMRRPASIETRVIDRCDVPLSGLSPGAPSPACR